MGRRLLMLPAVCAAIAAGSVLPASAAGQDPAVQLQPADGGGPSWYGQFSNPLPSGPGFFPIGVWYESVTTQADIDKDVGAGLNTYVVLTDNSSLPLIAANGMKFLAQHGEWTSRANAPGAQAIAGWELRDEVDMQLGPSAGYTELQRILAGLPADGRLRYNNYGKGVIFWHTDAEAARFVNAQDLVSADTYWFTDNDICSQWQGGALLLQAARALTDAECHRASNYGATVKRMRDLVSPPGSRPVWAFVEVGHPYTDSSWPTITPPEVRAAVWHSLIAGARGIIYFNHSFGGPNQTQHALRDPAYAAVRSTVSATNRLIAALAPALNAPTVSSGFSHDGGTRALAKWWDGHFYVFSGSAGSPVQGTFSLPCVGDATATVLDENRSVPMRGGSFSDSFADGNAIHVYRIDGGSTCGLPAGAGGTLPGGTSAPLATAAVGRLARRVRLRRGRLIVPVRCGYTCTVRSRLTTRVRARRVLLAASRRHFAPGRHRLVLRLNRRGRRLVARGGKPRRARLATAIAQPPGADARRVQRLVVRR